MEIYNSQHTNIAFDCSIFWECISSKILFVIALPFWPQFVLPQVLPLDKADLLPPLPSQINGRCSRYTSWHDRATHLSLGSRGPSSFHHLHLLWFSGCCFHVCVSHSSNKLSEVCQYYPTVLQLHGYQSWIAQNPCTDMMELDCQGTLVTRFRGRSVCFLSYFLYTGS